MIHHVVMIRLQEGLSEPRVERFLEQAREILGSIPGVSNLRIGRRAYEDIEYPLVLIMDFEDVPALEAYQVHPEHQRFLADVIDPIIADKFVVDFEDV